MTTDKLRELVERLEGRYKVGPDAEFGYRQFPKENIPAIQLEAATALRELIEQKPVSKVTAKSVSEPSGFTTYTIDPPAWDVPVGTLLFALPIAQPAKQEWLNEAMRLADEMSGAKPDYMAVKHIQLKQNERWMEIRAALQAHLEGKR